MEEYQHPLYFEAKDLTDREKEKIRRYFLKRRDSGGGECGLVEKVGGNIFKISFKDKEDQERVLRRKSHTISLPSGELRLTVSRTDSPQTPDQPSTSQSQTYMKENSKGLEKIFKPEIFLMYFLRDNPKALKVLQKQLSSIGCMVKLDFGESSMVVWGDIEKGPGGAFGTAEKWEMQVDRVYNSITERYLCYHVMEPKKVLILLLDVSLMAGDIIVYTEGSCAVVVGEVEAVNERIALLEKSVPTQKEIPVVEKRFQLVEDEFSRDMCALHPEVKVFIGSGRVILEGPDAEVQSGAYKLDELIKKVKEKRVKLSTALMNFMTSSGAMSKYQARFRQIFRSPVSLEVGSDLVFVSLSSDALNEAEMLLQRDLILANVPLQEAASSDLDRVKELLNKAKNEANSRELRVDVSFIPGLSGATATDVQLVGYSKNVNKLKEVLNDYQMNQAITQETLQLRPELLDCFDKITDMIGMKKTKVTLRASSFPYPCVLVSGPNCQVQEAVQALSAALASLKSETLVLDGPGALQYFQAEGKLSKELVESSCQVIIREKQRVHSPDLESKPQSTSSLFTSSSACWPTPPSRVWQKTLGGTPITKINLEIRLGSLEDEQVNVLVAPMLNKQLNSSKIGKCLLHKAGSAIKLKFDSAAANCTVVPGDVLQVDAPPFLGCSKLFFIECMPWDGVLGQSVKALGNGLKKCVDLCVQQRLSSVAFPIIGPGIILNYPLTEAIQVLTESIIQFGLSASSGSLATIHVVIKPGYPDSEECYHKVYRHLSSNMNQGGQAIFGSLTSDVNDIKMTVGSGVKLQLVLGAMTNETTDAVVNSTDFQNYNYDGVCRDILTVAGPEVEADLKKARQNRGDIFVTGPGFFPCKAILHVCGKKDALVIEQLVCRIIEHCELYELKSVAIPALSAGIGGLDPGVVAGAILRGVNAATSAPLRCLTDIRLVLFKIDVFLAFKKEATQMFPAAVTNRVPVLQLPPVRQQSPPSSLSTDLSILCTSSCSQQSVFLFTGLSKKDVDDAMTKLKDLYQAQCSTHAFKKEELAGLTADDTKDLKRLVETEGLYVQEDPSGRGALTVSGFRDGVNKVMQLINTACLKREVRCKEEDNLYARVAWCILGPRGNWDRLPKRANHKLENQDVAGGIVDAESTQWFVDLQTMQARRPLTGQTAKLKRLQHLSDFTIPLYWDNMAADEALKLVPLHSSSKEYQTVKAAFKLTVNGTVLKIERLQNVHLRRAYEAQKKHISDKNKQQGGAGEKLLYHGTTPNNCDSIMKTGFNRGFSGQNATSYGQGTYFAVNASYSASATYSRPAADGSQLMFVARVLTGVFTLGQSNMRVPPSRSNQRPHDRYDSVVDRMDNPNMYVVFHDNQAYPDYLITFTF